MNEETTGTRLQLIRDVIVLQIKLVADGFRDALLIPVSLMAAFLGLLRGGEDADREFRQVLKFGRQSDHWINLFGRGKPSRRSGALRSMDQLLNRVEVAVVEQYRKGKNPEEARAAISAALEETAGHQDGKGSAQ